MLWLAILLRAAGFELSFPAERVTVAGRDDQDCRRLRSPFLGVFALARSAFSAALSGNPMTSEG